MRKIIITLSILTAMAQTAYGNDSVAIDLLSRCQEGIQCSTDTDCEIRNTICTEAYQWFVKDGDQSVFETQIRMVQNSALEFYYERGLMIVEGDVE